MEILYDIVSAAKSPAKKTHLMYKSNLSFKQLELYLNFLMEQGLVEGRHDDESLGRVYQMTSRGLEFSSLFENLQTYLQGPRHMEGRELEIATEEYAVPSIQRSY